ncbi:MAG: (2Fe-2S) ferredoxin domain-containing protein [Candidatus Hydrogenedentes bacterium]|nr:(2Fe-2S) ferredoxin domain-containing protein [Candidatus Hydrogenedentota bacterium]
MLEHALPFQKIVFVCCNQREPGERECCANKGGKELRDKLKSMVKARNLQSKIRVSQSGCQDKCEHGPNLMVFPENRWFSHVSEAELEYLLESIIATLDGQPSNVTTQSPPPVVERPSPA